jgi:protein O-GlcNAc transferase
LRQRGVASDRIAFASPKPRQEYLALYDHVDVGLDTFPYNGHTTSLDSNWMGVPVVTLVGQTVVGRAGFSQLTNLGLEGLAATTREAFVHTAADLAGNLVHLQGLRAGLRERMRHSPLTDASGFTRGIEEAYRKMWRAWCSQNT